MFTETFLPSTDGIVTRLCATLRYLEREGHEVLLFAPSGSPREYASATIVGIPAMPFILYPEKRYALPLPRIGRKVKAFRPDLIHVVNPAFLGIGGIYYAWRFHLPLIASYHTNVLKHMPTTINSIFWNPHFGGTSEPYITALT
ncbi:glycosyltransferase [Alicyclobacillus sacchari]|uniref:glycosyltransferase n=1 Tax=Alicyclobacillus sacchari TaxID=392010 RepID=UPI0024E07A51|nr:glycosyltransferase [Alicyclobacillus sacchari]